MQESSNVAILEAPAAEHPAARRAGRRSLVAILLMLVVLGGALGGGFFLLQGKHEVNEDGASEKRATFMSSAISPKPSPPFKSWRVPFPPASTARRPDSWPN